MSVTSRAWRSRYLGMIAALALIGGCATVKLPPPAATPQTVEALRANAITPAAVGQFKLAAGKASEMDRQVGGLRGSSIEAPSGSYSQLLREQLIAELKGAGLFQEQSGIVITGELTDSFVDAAIGTGSARLAARYVVTRAGRPVYDKVLSVDSTWESSFVGAIALPKAINQYTSLYRILTRKFLEDPELRLAVKP